MAAIVELAKGENIESRTNSVDHGTTFFSFREENESYMY